MAYLFTTIECGMEEVIPLAKGLQLQSELSTQDQGSQLSQGERPSSCSSMFLFMHMYGHVWTCTCKGFPYISLEIDLLFKLNYNKIKTQ